MKLTCRILCAAFLVTFLLPLNGSTAEDEFMEGTLRAVRMEDKTVRMHEVFVYVPPEIADLREFSAGDEVVLEYTIEDGRPTAILLRKFEEG